MVRILITPQRLETESSRFAQAAADMNSINSQIARIVSNLDWQVRSRGSVEDLIRRAESDGRSLAGEADRLGIYLRTASQTFQNADAGCKARLEETTCLMPVSLGTAGTSAAAGGIIVGLVTGGQRIISTGLSWIRKTIGASHSNANNTQNPAIQKENIGLQQADDRSKSSNAVEPIEVDWGEVAKRKQRLADFSKDAYSSSFSEGQCTWYCFGRAQEKGTTLVFKDGKSGNAKDWIRTVENCNTSNAIRSKSIAVFPGPDERYGHVVFIEEVKENMVYFSEANWDNDIYKANPETDGIVKSMTISDFLTKRGNPSGYIYLK